MTENELLQIIATMAEEIENLKKRLSALEQTSSNPSDVLDDNSLILYYLNKYKTAASEIRKNRLENIETEIESLKEDQINLVEKLSIVEQDSISFNEKKNSFAEYEKTIAKNQLAIENCNFEYDRSCGELYKEVEIYDERYNDILRLYNNTLKSYYNGDIYPNELTVKINRIIRYFNSEGYQNSCDLIDIVNKLDVINNNYRQNIKKYQDEITEIKNVIAQISSEDPTLELKEIKSMVEDVNQELSRKEKVYNSLVTLIDDLIKNQENKIKDVISHNLLIEMSKTEIASSAENLLEKLLEELKNADTKENIKNSLILRLSQIAERLLELENLVAKHHQQEKLYEENQTNLETVNKNIITFEDFIQKVYQIIKSNQDYRFFYDEYVAGITKSKELNNNISTLKHEIEILKDKRKSLIIDPYAKQKVLEIDERISENEEQITIKLREINCINDNLKERSLNNERIFKMISDKEKIEIQLPLIKKKKEYLVEEIAKQFQELKKSDHVLEEYQKLLDESDRINAKLQEYNN